VSLENLYAGNAKLTGLTGPGPDVLFQDLDELRATLAECLTEAETIQTRLAGPQAAVAPHAPEQKGPKLRAEAGVFAIWHSKSRHLYGQTQRLQGQLRRLRQFLIPGDRVAAQMLGKPIDRYVGPECEDPGGPPCSDSGATGQSEL